MFRSALVGWGWTQLGSNEFAGYSLKYRCCGAKTGCIPDGLKPAAMAVPSQLGQFAHVLVMPEARVPIQIFLSRLIDVYLPWGKIENTGLGIDPVHPLKRPGTKAIWV